MDTPRRLSQRRAQKACKLLRKLLQWPGQAKVQSALMMISRILVRSCTEAELIALDGEALPAWATQAWVSATINAEQARPAEGKRHRWDRAFA